MVEWVRTGDRKSVNTRWKAETNCLADRMQRELRNHPCFLKEWARNKMTRITLRFSACQGRCDWLCAGWLHYSKCWCSSSLCSFPQSCTSVVCCHKYRIHGFKSTQMQRWGLSDKKVEKHGGLTGRRVGGGTKENLFFYLQPVRLPQ